MAGRDESPKEKSSGYLHLANVALPALRGDSVSQDAIETMLRDIARRFLTGDQAQASAL